ncbi:septum formation family protein [Nocardiopsis sp. NPDC101807]|uniref:septum formation family protein n=1 Tax=Nocardiopsis sp. NPDC101807 TaxID=3364339 RepID=UPI00380BA3B5
MSATRRPLLGRITIGILAVGASLSLSACGQLPLLPPALTGGTEVSPEPVETSETPETPAPEPVESEEPAGASDTDVFNVGLGDCLNEMTQNTDDQISEVPIIDCAEPHDYEVYHVEDIAESGEYPGDTAVQEAADTICRDAFDAWVGMAWAESGIDYTPLYPVEEGWNLGDREVLCLAYDMAGQVEGTLEGAGY